MQMKFVASFLALYEEQNFSRASAKLYITQQGLSRQIKALEDELDLLLFERSKQGAVPTEICETLYPVFFQMNEKYINALSLIEEEKKRNRKCISVAFAQGISNSGSAEFIFEYQKLHPEINIEILESTQPVCIQKLINKEIDMAFLVNPIDKSMFNAILLSEGYMYAAMHKTHPLAEGNAPIDFSLLSSENIITGSPQNALRGLFDYFCRLTNINPHIIVSSNYSINYVNSMTENIGIATVTCAMAHQITNPDIRFHRLLTPEPGYVFCCTPHKVKQEKQISALRNYVKRHFELEPLPKLDTCL
ncbi:MAG: LysR family transcriptional regulator [Oscillospiraceae bacterium]|nr:LysR family transcriptional regulator [Oscillospiraceae bacterium]